MQRTLKRELKELEIVEMEAFGRATVSFDYEFRQFCEIWEKFWVWHFCLKNSFVMA